MKDYLDFVHRRTGKLFTVDLVFSAKLSYSIFGRWSDGRPEAIMLDKFDRDFEIVDVDDDGQNRYKAIEFEDGFEKRALCELIATI